MSRRILKPYGNKDFASANASANASAFAVKKKELEEIDALNEMAIASISEDEQRSEDDVLVKTFFDQYEFETILENMTVVIPAEWLTWPISDSRLFGEDLLKNEAYGYYFNKGIHLPDNITERVLIGMELHEARQILCSKTGQAEVVPLTDPQKSFIGSGIEFYRYYKNVSNDILINEKIRGSLLSYLKIMYKTLSMFQASKELDDELQQTAKERNTGGYELVRYVDPKAIFSIQTKSREIQSFVVEQPFTRNFENTGLGRQINSFYGDKIFVDPLKPFNMIKANIIINTALGLALKKKLKFKTPIQPYLYADSIKVFMGIGYKNDANWHNFDLARVFREATRGNIDELLTQQDILGLLIFSSENSGIIVDSIIVDNVSPLASSSYDYNVALKFVKTPGIIYGVVISIIYGLNMQFCIASNSANEKEVIVLPCKLQLSKIFIDRDNKIVVFEFIIIEEITTVVLKTQWERVINQRLLPHIKKMYKGKTKRNIEEVLSTQAYGSQDPGGFNEDLVPLEDTELFRKYLNPYDVDSESDPDAGGSKPNRKSKSNRKSNRKTNKRRNQNKRKTNKRRKQKRRTNKRRRI